MEDHTNDASQTYTNLLDAEMRLIVNAENEDFIRTYCHLITEVITRSFWRVRRLEPTQFVRLYAELCQELAVCAHTLGYYSDKTIAGICISLRLQKRLNRVLMPHKRTQREKIKPKSVDEPPAKPAFTKVRYVA
ncbi:hypothetical protein [Cerasicoccus frondis]|uniref:hypothetical protein n=1 Tax=Cerasicoccus frondis TaxID=490090 RepID=UPI0028528924|nr:hypothetical protein [Cerasicoccus frondis]